MRLKTKPFFLFLCSALLWLPTQVVQGASCCGGSFAAPSLIVGDDKAQLTASYAHSLIAADVGTDSLWRKRETREGGETLKLEAAHIFWDQWQAGLSLPLVRRSRAQDSQTGLGDLAATLGYEYLPDWDYNPWRPRGHGFLQLTFPTGRSINEANTTYQLDSRGRGFWAMGAGTILTKILGPVDLFASLDAHRSFAKTFSQGKLKPGFGGNAGFGAGFSLASLRLGGAITWSYEDPVDVSGTVNSKGSSQRYATASLSASYLFPEEWAATLSYSNQTLFGSPLNTSLGRGISVFLQKRWLR